jgi:hypothetical protein
MLSSKREVFMSASKASPNSSIERTAAGKPASAAHVER